ncbi:uncharacterized protein LOC123545780 isoform X2 [Mercenaria mercenaria]|uniref:uncharacterized protein LOC123545780 isoform X2 n=1 Tax=Mercenaria mercenaria TaxID=6596 RepID=UPI001E1D7CAC|nr:uncharacterized protein LOC123545780 isoform X2 [Mercenaria mercenaria]
MLTNDNTEETKLHLAALESYSTGKITPLLKEELKYYIQSRRLSEGKNELVVDFNTVPKKSQLRPEEVARLERRREQNRRASEKFRGKKKTELQNLQKVCQHLEKRNKELLREVGNLQAERDAMYERVMKVLQMHDVKTY